MVTTRNLHYPTPEYTRGGQRVVGPSLRLMKDEKELPEWWRGRAGARTRENQKRGGRSILAGVVPRGHPHTHALTKREREEPRK